MAHVHRLATADREWEAAHCDCPRVSGSPWPRRTNACSWCMIHNVVNLHVCDIVDAAVLFSIAGGARGLIRQLGKAML